MIELDKLAIIDQIFWKKLRFNFSLYHWWSILSFFHKPTFII